MLYSAVILKRHRLVVKRRPIKTCSVQFSQLYTTISSPESQTSSVTCYCYQTHVCHALVTLDSIHLLFLHLYFPALELYHKDTYRKFLWIHTAHMDKVPYDPYLSYDDCLEVRGEIIKIVLCRIVY